jgi:quercetin dioxygenase-like cupin family protein
MKRIILIIIAGFLLLTPLAVAGAARATPPANAHSATLGRIHLGPFHETSHGFTISSRHPTDTVVLTTTIDPGGSTGWHSHPGPAFVVVVRGTLTLYDGIDPTCTPHRYGPGTGFLDPGFGHVHIARNEGWTPVTVVQTYLDVPPGGSPRIDEPAPGNCPF